MKKYIRTGVGEDIETFLEWFFAQDRFEATSKNGCIKAQKLNDNVVRLELKVKLGN